MTLSTRIDVSFTNCESHFRFIYNFFSFNLLKNLSILLQSENSVLDQSESTNSSIPSADEKKIRKRKRDTEGTAFLFFM